MYVCGVDSPPKEPIWRRSPIIPAVVASIVASGACTAENSGMNSGMSPLQFSLIEIIPALVLALSAIRPRVAGLFAICFAAPLYAIGLRLQTTLHSDELSVAAIACGVAVVLAAVGAYRLWRSEGRKAIAFGKVVLGGFATACYVALVLWLYPISG
jgi:uncharacterized membrane protein (UPF0136 family)